MTLNKKNFLFTIILFSLVSILTNCSSFDKDANNVNLDFFRNQGEKVELSNIQKNISKKEINKIKKLNPLSNVYDFSYDKELETKLTKNTKILKSKINSNIAYNNKYIFFINNKNKLQLFNYNLQNIKTITFTKNRFFNDLNFKILLDDNNVYIASKNGKLYSVNYLTQKKNWEINLGVPIVSNLVFYKKNIFLLNVNSKIFSINSSNGIINWSYETVSENFKSLKSYNLMIVKNTLIFSNDNGDLIAINLIKNSILWSLNLRESSTIDQGKIFEIFDISVNSNYLYISLKNGYFYKINIVNGVVKWKKLIRLQSSPVFLEKTIIFINNNNYLIIADKYSGSILFSKNLNSQLKNNKVKKVITFNKVLALAKSLYLLSDNSDITFKINLSNLENFKIIELKPSIIDNFFIKNKNIFFTDKKNLINKITINDY